MFEGLVRCEVDIYDVLSFDHRGDPETLVRMTEVVLIKPRFEPLLEVFSVHKKIVSLLHTL